MEESANGEQGTLSGMLCNHGLLSDILCYTTDYLLTSYEYFDNPRMFL